MKIIEKFPVQKLKLYPENPRKMSAREFDALVKSLENFGVVEPLVINSQYEVIGGNQRLLALRKLGIETVPVVLVELPLSKEKALNLALNRIQGEWDFTKLSSFIKDIEEADLDLTGFEDTELNLMGFEGEAEKAIEEFEENNDTAQIDTERNVVVYLSFENLEKANKWLEDNGFKERLREGTETLVVDMSKYEE
jgi:ParB-like chromosome segregation protein Spo0J